MQAALSFFRRFYFGEEGSVTLAGLVRLNSDLRHVVEAHRLTNMASQLGSVWEYEFSHQVGILPSLQNTESVPIRPKGFRRYPSPLRVRLMKPE
jgi:hypothetical protein